jgi:basic membrane lipoprotein Med (substrate-binding protein (PBP1-ABC) superfamily)
MHGRACSKWRGARVALTAAVVAGVFGFAAAGSPAKTLKIGAALVGPKNDTSFNQAAYMGIQRAINESHGQLQLTSVLENLATDQQRTQAVETLAPLNDIIVGASFSFGPIFMSRRTSSRRRASSTSPATARTSTRTYTRS